MNRSSYVTWCHFTQFFSISRHSYSYYIREQLPLNSNKFILLDFSWGSSGAKSDPSSVLVGGRKCSPGRKLSLVTQALSLTSEAEPGMVSVLLKLNLSWALSDSPVRPTKNTQLCWSDVQPHCTPLLSTLTPRHLELTIDSLYTNPCTTDCTHVILARI